MRLSLCIEPSSIELQFSDDGKGFDPEYVKASGLENVRQRAQRCGGHAKLYSAIGKGTQHKVTLPRMGG
jgi:signal transduction histidine kinase